MKSIVIQEAYGLEKISLVDRAIPVVKPDEVLVKVQAISLNQLDLMIARGAFGTSLPHTLGSDATGYVVETGHLVTAFKQGDRVSTHFMQNWQSGTLQPDHLTKRLGTDVEGVFSEYIALPERALVAVPAHLTPAEAATLPIAGVTAWHALFETGQLKPGQTVLLQGTGGVSILAQQFAKAAGARVIITSGNNRKLDRAKALGADEIINYKQLPDWHKTVLALTDGAGVDLALELSWAELDKTVQATRLGGRIAVIGLLGGTHTNLSVFGIMQKSISITGLQVGSRATFDAMNRAIASNRIRPVVDRIYTLDKAAEAFAYVEQGGHFGKVVITF